MIWNCNLQLYTALPTPELSSGYPRSVIYTCMNKLFPATCSNRNSENILDPTNILMLI